MSILPIHKLVPLLLLFLGAYGHSQINKKEGDTDNFDHYAYMQNIESYPSLLKKGYDEITIYKKLGNANYHNANYDVATFWYEKLLENDEIAISPDYLYRYALALKSIKRYEDSHHWMEKFKKIKKNDIRASLYADNTDYLKEIQIPKEQYTIKNLIDLNSEESDFAPSYLSGNLVFTTARDLDVQTYNKLPYLNLYQTEIKEDGQTGKASGLSETLNTKANESSTAFSKDGKTVYFTRNNFSKKSFKRDKNGISRLKIYRSRLTDGTWSEPEDLPFNNSNYSVAHPSLSSDGTKLYFASDMPGGMGASDIYVVDILSNGKFGEPKNLGKLINTEEKETFPFISDSGILYFASNGHPGLGGLDIFKIDINKNDKVSNMGSPINSPDDDFSLVMDASGEIGYFASNRKGGIGNDDIYILKRSDSDCFTFIEGIARDKDTDKPLAETLIEAFAHDGETLSQTVTASDGSYTLRIPCQKEQYQLSGTKEGYEASNLYMLTPKDKKQVQDVHLELEQSTKVADLGSDLVKLLELTPIYFDLNSSYLRKDAYAELDKVVDYMSKRPDIKIAVGSHTDSREGDAYNLWLSRRRAMRTVEYITSKGIDPSRISGKGYGETQLLNRCANGVKCSESEHQLNRRSEFIVIEK
ncbi:OmpA family protein [Zobellia galactanivorans]|uniref:OmpA-like periplasmic protein n=1 Tax=Zobellia galactanivorans (strain DSM 12802 / CCUG 47099 / CIP 106680 / NCIMB 13871 / Dsij) TaxID=63186 RepID=G0LCM9_ZOBGA|nr:OmpA family protein [Zobellia galactanivorans]MBU3025493.1 OmpA family protein [Zobellia galactanivorans]CAZ97040.1 OmpA-like periplasmic protein [Zobellia galactanivorans]